MPEYKIEKNNTFISYMKQLIYLFLLITVIAPFTANAQELIKNGDFELNPRVERGTSATTGWNSSKPVTVVYVDPISANNPHYAVICCDTLYYNGANGIDVADSTKYDFSICMRNIPALKAENRTEGNKLVIVQLVNEQGKAIAETTIRVKGNSWQKFERQFTASATCPNARLAIVGIACAKVAIDNVSLKKH